MSLLVESNELSKSGLGIEIGRFCVKIQLLSHHKTTEIATSWENWKNSIFNICIFFDWFRLILVENDLKWNFKWKKVKTSTFQFFRFSQEVAISRFFVSIKTPEDSIDEFLFQEPTTKISAPNFKYYGFFGWRSEVRFSSFYMENQKAVNLFQF